MLSRASLVIVIAFCSAACGDDDPSTTPDAQVITDAGLDTAAPGDATASSDGSADLTTPSQRIVVLADNETTYKAAMYAFERSAGGWSKVFSHPVTLGKNGLAWGRGLHDAADLPKGAKMKQEGDGKSPMGLFALTQGWGYLAPASVATKLPYTTATDKLICVDDVGSSYYNQVIDWQAEGLTAGSLPSHEKMLLSSVVYKYTVFVAHNAPNAQPGAGSCIFLHVWGAADAPTIGCTAMAQPHIEELLGWLLPSKNPVLVQLPRAEYEALAATWALPRIP